VIPATAAFSGLRSNINRCPAIFVEVSRIGIYDDPLGSARTS
jgi:hypothetical protein